MHKFFLKGFLISLFVLFVCCQSGRNQEAMVLEACEYIPNHGLKEDAELHLTQSYYNAYAEAFEAPTVPGEIGDEEFLYYFVSGQDGEPIFSVVSIEESDDCIIAQVSVRTGIDGIPWEDEEPTIHTLRLVRSNNGRNRYLVDNWDDTKQQCVSYIKQMRRYYKSGRFDKALNNNVRSGYLSSEERQTAKNALRDYYSKWGEDFRGDMDAVSAEDNNQREKTSSFQSKSSSNYSSPVEFTSEMMVNAYLRGKKFVSNDGSSHMTFSSNNEMVVDGRIITATMGVLNFTPTTAVLRGYCPFDGSYVRIIVDSSSGKIINYDEPSDVYYLQK